MSIWLSRDPPNATAVWLQMMSITASSSKYVEKLNKETESQNYPGEISQEGSAASNTKSILEIQIIIFFTAGNLVSTPVTQLITTVANVTSDLPMTNFSRLLISHFPQLFLATLATIKCLLFGGGWRSVCWFLVGSANLFSGNSLFFSFFAIVDFSKTRVILLSFPQLVFKAAYGVGQRMDRAGLMLMSTEQRWNWNEISGGEISGGMATWDPGRQHDKAYYD